MKITSLGFSYVHMLCNRTVVAEWSSASVQRYPTTSCSSWKGEPVGLLHLPKDELIVREKLLDTPNDLKHGHLSFVTNWSANCRLTTNPGKTKLVQFTRKYKVLNAQHLSIDGSSLVLSDRVK